MLKTIEKKERAKIKRSFFLTSYLLSCPRGSEEGCEFGIIISVSELVIEAMLLINFYNQMIRQCFVKKKESKTLKLKF